MNHTDVKALYGAPWDALGKREVNVVMYGGVIVWPRCGNGVTAAASSSEI